METNRKIKTTELIGAFVSRHWAKIYVLILTLAAAVLVYYRLQIQLARGPGFDTYAFLDNALMMAGKSDYFEIYRPPFLSFLASIFFRLGFDGEIVIYLIDGFFFVLGVIGFYLLLKLRFSPPLSFLGALLLMSFPDTVEAVTFGLTDIMALSLSIWTIYFLILAVEKSRRFYLVAFPLFIVSFFTRFPAVFMLFPIVFYLLSRENILRNLKYIAGGVVIASLIFATDLFYYASRTGGELLAQFSTPFQVASFAEYTPGVTEGPSPGRFFFATNFLKFISSSKIISFVFASLVILSLVALVTNLLNKKRGRKTTAVLALVVILLASGYLIFSKVHPLLASILILVLFSFLLTLFDLEKNRYIDLLLLLWFLIYFNYHTHQVTKVSRYFVTMTPGFTYLVIAGFSFLIANIQKYLKKSLLYSITVIILTFILILFGSYSTILSYRHVQKLGQWGMPATWKKASTWLKPKLKRNDVVFADDFVATAWHLRKPIKPMPLFKDPGAFNHELEKNQADYFISIWHQEDFSSYRVIKSFDKAINIYKRKGKPLPNKPKVFLIGKDVDHYLEDLLDFKFYLIRKRTPFPDDQSQSVLTTYIDAYKLEELKGYPLLVLYNFRWYEREKVERLLKDYLNSGGTIMIDASGNLGKAQFDLANKDFLGVNILREGLPKYPQVSIGYPELKKGVEETKFGPFIDESGEEWMGTAYRKITNGSPVEKLVTVNGKNLISIERRGKGKIIWVGYNFFFHAFFHENPEEKQLIQNLFWFSIK